METEKIILVARNRTAAIEFAKAQIRATHGAKQLYNCFIKGANTTCHCGNCAGVTVTVTVGKGKGAAVASSIVAVCGVCF